MATPFFQIQNLTMVATRVSPGQMRILTKDAAGAPIDVSSGFTLHSLLAVPTADYNVDGPEVVLTSDVSAAFDTTGVTLSWTGTQANTITAALPTLHSNLLCYLTNDTGTTRAMVGSGTLLANVFGGAV